MNTALNTVVSRVQRIHRGHLRLLDEIDSSRFVQVTPRVFFPQRGVVRLGHTIARQHTAQTCGTTVLVLANGLFDADLMDLLEVGDLPNQPGPRRGDVARERFTMLQKKLLGQVTGRSWPMLLGTPPWGMARELQIPGVDYRHLPLDDRNPALMETVLPTIRRATDSGIPVPLYVGGDLRTSVASAVPRHVVLALPPAAVSTRLKQPGIVHLYEPQSGRVFRRRWEALRRRTRPDPAFGGWTHLAWVVLPTGQ